LAGPKQLQQERQQQQQQHEATAVIVLTRCMAATCIVVSAEEDPYAIMAACGGPRFALLLLRTLLSYLAQPDTGADAGRLPAVVHGRPYGDIWTCFLRDQDIHVSPHSHCFQLPSHFDWGAGSLRRPLMWLLPCCLLPFVALLSVALLSVVCCMPL
jgi:hypothetical protein